MSIKTFSGAGNLCSVRVRNLALQMPQLEREPGSHGRSDKVESCNRAGAQNNCKSCACSVCCAAMSNCPSLLIIAQCSCSSFLCFFLSLSHSSAVLYRAAERLPRRAVERERGLDLLSGRMRPDLQDQLDEEWETDRPGTVKVLQCVVDGARRGSG